MARTGIYKSHVIRARDRLLAQGQRPTIDAVRIELGNTGSRTTIHRYLKEIEEEEGGRRPPPQVAVSDSIAELVGRLSERLADEVQAEFKTYREQAEAEKKRLQAVVDEMSARLKAQQAFHGEQAAEIEALTGQTSRLTKQSESLAQELDARTQAVAQLEARLAEQQALFKTMEARHQHAVDALEHFRTAAREQREQLVRQHDSQQTYLQGELRRAQENLKVSQNELRAAEKTVLELSTLRQADQSMIRQLETDRVQWKKDQAALHEAHANLAAREQSIKRMLTEQIEREAQVQARFAEHQVKLSELESKNGRVAARVGLLEAEKEALENEKVALKERCEALVQQVKAQEAALGAFPKPPSTSG